MDDWQKDFWEAIETVVDNVTITIDNFFVEVTRTIDEVNREITDDLERFVSEILPPEWEEFLSSPSYFYDNEFDDTILTPKVNPDPDTHPACIGCKNYHGYIYGGNLLVCALHPYGSDTDTCPDHESDNIPL